MIITYCMLLKLKVRLILLSHIEWILINRVTRAVDIQYHFEVVRVTVQNFFHRV